MSDSSIKRMKRRQLLLSLALLPTITETLEDSVLPCSSSSSSSQTLKTTQTLEDPYMSSIQALARPTEAPSHGPVRLQLRTQRPRLFSNKAQMKHSASASSLPRGSPRALRTPRLSPSSSSSSSLNLSAHEDPVDWLFGQSQSRT